MPRCGAASTVNEVIQGRDYFPCIIVWHYYVSCELVPTERYLLYEVRICVCTSQHGPGQGMNTSPGAGGRRPWRTRGVPGMPACQVPDPRCQEIRVVCKHDTHPLTHCATAASALRASSVPQCPAPALLRACAGSSAPSAPGYRQRLSECNTILTPAPRMILNRRPTVLCTFSCPLHVPSTSHRTTCS